MTYDFETGDLPLQWRWQRSHAPRVSRGYRDHAFKTHTHTLHAIMRRRYVYNMQSPTVRDVLIYAERYILHNIILKKKKS